MDSACAIKRYLGDRSSLSHLIDSFRCDRRHIETDLYQVAIYVFFVVRENWIREWIEARGQSREGMKEKYLLSHPIFSCICLLWY